MNPVMADNPHDPELATLLDAYLCDVHQGMRPDRDALLAQHPELAPLLDCLEALDRLAPAATPVEPPAAREPPTMTTPIVPVTWVQGELGPVPPVTGWFGNYELLGELGRGGMGVVYRARQHELGRIVALKMILANQLASKEQIKRFQAEAKVVARLSHPHIVQIYEAGEVHGQHFFAMQYVDGISLAQRLQQGPLPLEEIVTCLACTARAVAYLHARGIVHRDLKPANILLDGTGYPYVTDFGLVKLLEGESRVTGSSVIVGTPSYMAPEQAAGRHASIGPASDIYSLGAILYELLTGRPPFREHTPLDTLVQVLEGEPVPPRRLNPAIAPDLELICMKCLSKQAEHRYASAAALADDLERFSRGEAIAARPQSWGPRLQRWVRQEPALASHLGVLAVMSAISHLSYQLFHRAPLVQQVGIQATLAVWALLSILCQWLLRREYHGDMVRNLWLAIDAILMTAELWLVNGVYSPLLILYGLYIVAAGFWFRTGFVWFATALALTGYCLLLADAAPRGALGANWHHHGIFLAALVALGFMVAYQVRRVRVLSQYYEHRPLP
jgi:serine/threonine-protein kinase